MTDADLSAFRSWCLAHGHAVRTVEKSARMLRFFVREFHMDLSDMTESSVIEFLASRREAGVKTKTLNGYVRELNLWSRYSGLGWKFPYFRRVAPVRIHEVDAVLEERLRSYTHPDPGVAALRRALIWVAFDSGLRREELLRIRLEDLHDTPAGPTISVERGKGDKPRLVYISQRAGEILRAYIGTYRPRTHPTALWTTRKGPVTYAYLGKLAKVLGAQVGAPWFHWHHARRRCVSRLWEDGVSLGSIQALMGHSRPETTLTYASERSIKDLTEKEVRESHRRHFRPLSPVREAVARVHIPAGSRTWTDGSTGMYSLTPISRGLPDLGFARCAA